MKSPLARTACFLSLSLFLSGCGNDPNPKPIHDEKPSGQPWLVRYGALSDEPRSLDPQFAYDEESQALLESVQDKLLEYDPMKTDPYEVVPCILESIPQPAQNPDGTVDYLCKIKPGIFFFDDPCFSGGKGREVVAADVQYAFQRICDPKVECPVSANLSEYVAGMDEAMNAAKNSGGVFDYDKMKVSGIEVIDAHTFKIHLLKPYPQIKYWLAMNFTCPVAREAVDYYDGQPHPDGPGGGMVTRPMFKFHPVGDGPFKIAEHVPNQRYRLVRNENYHTTVFPSGGWPAERDAVDRPLAGHPVPIVDEVDLTVFREALPMWLLARQGYLDRMGVMQDAFNALINVNKELAPEYAARGMSLIKVQDVSTFFANFNMQDPVLGPNKKLRQALSCAYNRQGEIDLLYGGVAPVAQQLIPPGIFGYQKDYQNPYGYDLEKAKRLIAEAGYPNGIDPKTGRPLELTMEVVAAGSDERVLAEYMQRQFEQLGIKIKVNENTFAREQEKQDEGNFQIDTGSGWGADYPDAENFFFLFTSNNLPPDGKNVCRYKNPEFDRLFAQMATMENSPERMEVIRKMNGILAEDCPVMFTFNKAYYVLVQPWAPVTHVNTLLVGGGLKYVTLDNALREQKRREWNPVAFWPIPLGLALALAGIIYAVRMNRRRNV